MKLFPKIFNFSDSGADARGNFEGEPERQLYFDMRGGQPIGEYSVYIDDENLVFDYSDVCDFHRQQTEGAHHYLLLSSLVKPIKRTSKKTRDYKSQYGQYHFYADDIDYLYASDEQLIEVATELGPLFGKYGIQENQPKVFESKESWYFAAKVINFCLRAEGALFNPQENLGSLDNDLFYQFSFFDSDDCQQIVSKTFGSYVPEPYRLMLKLKEEQKGLLQAPRAYTKDSYSRALWIEPLCDKDTCALILVVFIGNTFSGKPNIQRFSGSDVRGIFALQNKLDGKFDSETEYTAEESMIDALIQALILLHVSSVKLDWGVVESGGGTQNVALDFSYNSYLQRIWHDLSRVHSKRIIRICERCGVAFPAENDRKSPQRFCGEDCQVKAKKARQNKREKARKELVDELRGNVCFGNVEEYKKYIFEKMRPYYQSDSDLEKQLDTLAEKILRELDEIDILSLID